MFSCQLSIGETIHSEKPNFFAYNGVRCNNLPSVQYAFELLIEHYNNAESAMQLCNGGDIIKISANIANIERLKDSHGLHQTSVFIDNINSYFAAIEHAPPVFLWCTRLNRWLFFTKSYCELYLNYSVTAHDVESLTFKKTNPYLLTM